MYYPTTHLSLGTHLAPKPTNQPTNQPTVPSIRLVSNVDQNNIEIGWLAAAFFFMENTKHLPYLTRGTKVLSKSFHLFHFSKDDPPFFASKPNNHKSIPDMVLCVG